MDHGNRPYKGMQAELAERERLYEANISSIDSVIEAAKTCIILGLCTSFIGIGFAFFPAAFLLGVYAMATHRIKQGVIICLTSIVISMVGLLITYAIFALFSLSLFALLMGKGPTLPNLK